MSGHTPGPWSVWTSCSYRRIGNNHGQLVCEPIVQHSDGHPDLHFRNGGADGPDARLIAAAPCLLALLEKWIGDGLLQTYENREQFREEARDLIAKATGAQP